MKIKQIKSNQTELHLGNGTIVLFSYETPVAAIVNREGTTEVLVTNRKYSRTTSKHISQWLDRSVAREVSPDYLAGLCGPVVVITRRS